MTHEDFKRQVIELEKKFEYDKRALRLKYVEANNPYKIGDIVTDHTCTIKIESVGAYLSSDNPCAVYKGLKLNKDGTPNKKGVKEVIYQSNLV